MMRAFLIPAGAFVLGATITAAIIYAFDRLIGQPYYR